MTDTRMLLGKRAAVAFLLGAALTSCLTPPAQPAQSAGSATTARATLPLAATTIPRAVPGLPASFAWFSSAPLIVPKSDAAHDLVAVKDPTVVRYNNRWHVYASSVGRGGVYGMVYTSFADWKDAPVAPLYYMDQTRGFHTYVAAPELFYFTPQKKWYLVFQSGPPMFSTADDPGDPTKWTEPAPFFAKTPAVVEANGGWLDFWVICDAQKCHLFFSNDHGRWYRSETPLAKFPYGWSDPVVVLEDAEAGRVFEASNVYKLAGTNQYLALIEAFDKSSGFKRYFRSWTAERLEGPWTPLHHDATTPFAGAANVDFDGQPWTQDISHGEMIRAGYDETLAIDGTMLRYLYQVFDRAAPARDYNAIPWRLGLLIQSSPAGGGGPIASRPVPAKLWAGDRGCLTSAPAKGDDKKGTESGDLIVRMVQSFDSSFESLEIAVAVDGRTVLNLAQGGGLPIPPHFVRVPGVAPGAHTLSIANRLAGKRTSNAPDASEYKFRVLSSHTFNVEPAQTTCLSVLLYFADDPQLALGERPRIDFREERAPLKP